MPRLTWLTLCFVGCVGDFPAPPAALAPDALPPPPLDATAPLDAAADAAPPDASPPDPPRCDAPELCDGLDQDCDGQVDEAVPLRACPLQQGVCQGSRQPCEGGAYQPCRYDDLDQPYTLVEGPGSCDGADNDCDGAVDEGCACEPGDSRVCGSDLGRCVPGRQFCQEGIFGPCVDAIAPGPEACNAEDDDCDGRVDEELAGDRCRTEWVGLCGEGRLQCEQAMAVCVPVQPPAAEDLCDGVDNDCDGRVDEGHVDDGCLTGFPGACERGALRCEAGVTRCALVPQDRPEVADGRDDDCDGLIDEGLAPNFSTLDLADLSVGGPGVRPGLPPRVAMAEGLPLQAPGRVLRPYPLVDAVFVPANGPSAVARDFSFNFLGLVGGDEGARVHAKGPAGLVPDPAVVLNHPEYADPVAHSSIEVQANYGISFDLEALNQLAGRPAALLSGRVASLSNGTVWFLVIVDGVEGVRSQIAGLNEGAFQFGLRPNARVLTLVILNPGEPGAHPASLGDLQLHFP